MYKIRIPFIEYPADKNSQVKTDQVIWEKLIASDAAKFLERLSRKSASNDPSHRYRKLKMIAES